MTKQATQFTAPSGKSFVYLSDMPFWDGELLFSPDGVTYYALAIAGVGGNRDEHDLSFSDPHQGVSGRLLCTGDAIDYDGEQYAQQDTAFDPSSVSVIPLPAARRTEYLCQAEDGTLYYVSSDKYNYSYRSFKLFVGDGVTMREIPIKDIARYRDGGTTYIQTPEETFFSTSPFNAQRNPELVPQWGSQKLTDLNPDDYDIVETPEGTVSITKR